MVGVLVSEGAVFRPRRWLDRLWDVEGSWPVAQTFVAGACSDLRQSPTTSKNNPLRDDASQSGDQGAHLAVTVEAVYSFAPLGWMPGVDRLVGRRL